MRVSRNVMVVVALGVACSDAATTAESPDVVTPVDVPVTDVASDIAALDELPQSNDATGDAETEPSCTVADPNACTTLEWDPESKTCVSTPHNEGASCGESTCVHTAGTCQAGVCALGPAPCQDVDPDGCWTSRCDDSAGTTEWICVVDDAPNATPCTEDRLCLGGACSFSPTCTGASPNPASGQYDAMCAGNTGCNAVCTAGICGCWQCDGPFCVRDGCDDTTTEEAIPKVTWPLGSDWGDEPAAGVPQEPAPVVTAAASALWTGEPPFEIQMIVSIPLPTDAASVDAGGTVSKSVLDDPSAIGVRLLVARFDTVVLPCEQGTQMVIEPEVEVVLPSAGDVGTTEFQFEASPSGTTLVAYIRVLQDTSGDRYFQWVRLGGFNTDSPLPPGEPVDLGATTIAPLPEAIVQPLGGLWSGFDWKKAVVDSLPQ